MSFLTGKQVTTGPQDASGLRQGLINFLNGGGGAQGFSTLLFGDTSGLGTAQGLFQQSLAPVLAQAKESTGNITGSGLANTLGTAAGRSTSDFLTNFLNSTANRYSSLLGGLATGGYGGGYQPGFLDYLFQGLGQAAPLFAGGA